MQRQWLVQDILLKLCFFISANIPETSTPVDSTTGGAIVNSSHVCGIFANGSFSKFFFKIVLRHPIASFTFFHRYCVFLTFFTFKILLHQLQILIDHNATLHCAV
jgi:hypothetical protein